MKKTVILSTNQNPDYLNYLPYCQKAWSLLGWNTLTFMWGASKLDSGSPENRIIHLELDTMGCKESTIVQCIRLLGHRYLDEGLMMLGDVDMLPLSNYWNPDPNEITCYGIDLTGDEQIPMCYVAASVENWNKIIPEQTLEELLLNYPQSKSPHFQDYWFTVQNILTERINKLSYTLIDRRFNGHLAAGRIDRADWERTVTMGGQKIDAHMLRPFNLEQTIRVMNLIQP